MDYFESAVYAKLFGKSAGGGGGEITVDGALSPTSTHPVQNQAIYNALADKASLTEENTFAGKNNFNAESHFNAPLEITEEVNITNNKIKLLDNTAGKDTVTQLSADGIEIDENGDTTSHVISFPRETGTLVTDATINLIHSSIKNVDENSDKEDTWVTTDTDAALTVKHQDENSYSGLSVSKDFVSINRVGSDGTARVAISSNDITLNAVSAENGHKTVVISDTSVTIDGSEVITASGGNFDARPTVTNNGGTSPVVIHDDLASYVPEQSSNGDSKQYSQISNEDGEITLRVFDPDETVDKATFHIDENGVDTSKMTVSSKLTLLGEPTEVTDAVTKGYVDDKVSAQHTSDTSAFVSAKTADEGVVKAYTINGTNSQDVCQVSMDGVAAAIVRYSWDGTIHCIQNPSTSDDLCRKGYIDAIMPAWRTTAPTTNPETTVLFTRVKITALESSQYAFFNGKEVLVPGYTNDGFTQGTIICPKGDADASDYPFMGSMTSAGISGVYVKTTNATPSLTTINTSLPSSITFSYTYLW